MRLFSYQLTHDSGFAPNPFYKILTLATCKPGMRRTKKKGDWIAGFSSKGLTNISKQHGVQIDHDALIYLGKVSEVLPIEDYFYDDRFKCKIAPKDKTEDLIACAGDNIYRPVKTESNIEFEQVSTLHHDESNKTHDLGGKNVLIFEEYYYLGRNGIPIDKKLNISRPKGRPTSCGYKTNNNTEILSLIEWVKDRFKLGLNAMPCLWQESIRNTVKNSCGG